MVTTADNGSLVNKLGGNANSEGAGERRSIFTSNNVGIYTQTQNVGTYTFGQRFAWKHRFHI